MSTPSLPFVIVNQAMGRECCTLHETLNMKY